MKTLFGQSIIEVIGASKELSVTLGSAEQAFRDTRLAAKFQAEVMQELDKSYGGAAERLAHLLGLTERNTRVNKEAADRQTAVTDALKEMGVSLESDVNAAIEKNNKLIEDATILYDQRIRKNGELIVNHEDLARITVTLTAKNAELTGSLKAQNAAVDESTDSFAAAKEGAASYGNELETLAEKTRRLAAEEAAAAAARGNGGGSSFGGMTSGGSKLFPNSALANTAYRGGVAVDVRAKNFYN